MNFGDGLKEFVGVVDRHGQHVCNAFASIPDFQGFPVESLAVARLARHVHVGQEVHLHRPDACAFAGFASPSSHVKRESAFFVASDFGLGKEGELGSNQIHQSCVGGRIGARRPTDGTLVYGDALVDVLQACDVFVRQRDANVAVKVVKQCGQQGLVDQGAFAASADAADTHQTPQRDFDIHLLEVVAGGAFEDEVFSVPLAPLRGNRDGLRTREVLGRDGAQIEVTLRRALRHDLAAVHARPWTDVHKVV